MKLTFLGTGTSQGVPVITCNCEVCTSKNPKDKRLRTSAHIETADGQSIVIDTGPDFRQQMLRENIKTLDAVIFTHEHKDHNAGLDDIRPFNFAQQRDMDIYATKRVQKALEKSFDYIFAEVKYPGVPQIHFQTIENKPFCIDKLKVTPIEVLHYKLPVLGFRFGSLSYITDANYISPKEKDKIKGSKKLIINALRTKNHISHFTLNEAIELATELEVKEAYFTHISHQMGKHDEVQKILPGNMFLAYDGLAINFD